MKQIHIGRDIVRAKIRWLVLVKMYGNNPKKLLIRIKVNILSNKKVLPLMAEGPNRVLNSL